MTQLKEKIITLRQKGASYREIERQLCCSKSTIAFHCQKLSNHKSVVENLSQHNIIDEIASWSIDKHNLISYLYSIGAQQREISDVTKSSLASVKSFCTNIRPFDHSALTNYEKVKLRRRRLKILGIIYKGGKCRNCEYSKCLSSMDFHHPNSNKDFNISEQSSWAKIKAELDKCDLLCANCHRESHSPDKSFDQLFSRGIR